MQLTVGTVAPDLDGDGDVDQEDFGRMQTCYSGQGIAVASGCGPADFDGDGDADVDDFQVFAACLSRPGQPAARNCTGR